MIIINDEQRARIEEIAKKAQQSFWNIVAKNIPEAITKDFGIGETFVFNRACETAIAHWIECNVLSEGEDNDG